MSDTMEIALGTPVISRSRHGFVSHVKPSDTNSFVLGGGTMQRTQSTLEIVWDNNTITREIPDGIAWDWVRQAERANLPHVADHAERRQAALDAERARHLENEEHAKAARLARQKFEEDYGPLIPANAKAVIVAERVRDDSDSMSDYFGSITEETVILAFSAHTRDLFPELRKAARNFDATAFLADAPADAEHREKWSMGAGYYLKTGYRHSDGWQVRKVTLRGVQSLPMGKWAVPADRPQAQATAVAGSVRIEEHTHTKRGFQMFIVIMAERVERDEFDRLRGAAEALGGWYSRPWGSTPGGFAFKEMSDAQAFADGLGSQAAPSDKPAGNAGMAQKLRDLADRLQADIDHALRDRQTNTPKRQREAATARQEGYKLQRAQFGLRKLADMHDTGTVPPILAKLATKAAAVTLAASRIDRSNAGYYDAGIDTGKPESNSPEALAFWELLGGSSDETRKAEELRAKVDGLRFANIPGFFPTPAAVVAQMLDHMHLPTSSAIVVLEPEAGSGAILDQVQELAPNAELVAFERHSSLCDVLRLKGYAVTQSDFLEAAPSPLVDLVLMNPPFENGQDVDHVRHAFHFLKPSGRLVAIMSTGPFFRQDKRSQAFRDWFDDLGGERYDIPAGAFRESGTGIATVLVVLDAED